MAARERMPGEGKIVVVDDELIVRETLARLVHVLTGYDVECYSDAQPFLDQLPATHVVAILTDLQMPTRGEELIRRVRAHDRQIPIIAVSGFATDEVTDRLLEMGADRVIRKPTRIDELEEVLSQFRLLH
ncbi:MAG TPA: response regulator [Candidatus Latescibacteria bacterium]|jgi:two-component system C4-dicarboxylate transport response regulator DctD|nr:two-component system response regulator [Gemmatimonadaceae bacterium]MDP6018626.1 response regulator [Candidatus Latescibacterota bacterium]HJP29937.1 response regulator [Candidatus Latescibacterota bacterium]